MPLAPALAGIRRLRLPLVLAVASLVALGCAELTLPVQGSPSAPAPAEHPRRARQAAEQDAPAAEVPPPVPVAEPAPPPPPADAQSAVPGCLLADPHFQRGAEVNDPQEGVGHRVIGRMAGLDAAAPKGDWGLSQWNTRTPFSGEVAASGGDSRTRVYRSGSKEVVFGPPGAADGEVELGLDSGVEYGGKPRPAGVRWPHLLLWQKFQPRQALSTLSSVRFTMDYRLSHLEPIRTSKPYDPATDAAQFSVFLTVQNKNKESKDFGHYVWFGLPLYDNRYAMAPHHEQLDKFTQKFIYLVDASKFADGPAASGRWIHADADLVDEMKTAVRTAKRQGYFESATGLDDFYITGLNFGWELPGSFDARMQVRNLSLCVE